MGLSSAQPSSPAPDFTETRILPRRRKRNLSTQIFPRSLVLPPSNIRPLLCIFPVVTAAHLFSDFPQRPPQSIISHAFPRDSSLARATNDGETSAYRRGSHLAPRSGRRTPSSSTELPRHDPSREHRKECKLRRLPCRFTRFAPERSMANQRAG